MYNRQYSRFMKVMSVHNFSLASILYTYRREYNRC